MQPVIYMDMDNVMVEFVRGALNLHGRHIPDGEVQWDFNRQLNIPDEQFWTPMNRQFWANLTWTEEGKEILKCAEDCVTPTNILFMSMSPAYQKYCPEAYAGKLDWIREHTPLYKRQYSFCPAKHLCASPRHILIDDSDANINSFRTYGGIGILVPRSWNSARERTTNNRFDVSVLLEEIRRKVKECSTA